MANDLDFTEVQFRQRLLWRAWEIVDKKGGPLLVPAEEQAAQYLAKAILNHDNKFRPAWVKLGKDNWPDPKVTVLRYCQLDADIAHWNLDVTIGSIDRFTGCTHYAPLPEFAKPEDVV